MMRNLSLIDRVLFTLAILSLIATVIYYFTDQAAFTNDFAIEDGPVEYGTAFFLLLASMVLLRNAAALKGKRGLGAALVTGFFALLFFFAAGEEISWGQRIFGWESNEYFKQANAQQQTNIHNLVVGDIRLVKTLFGGVLSLVLLTYLVVLPLLCLRFEALVRLANRLVIPLPDMRHMGLTLLATLVIFSIQMMTKWEVYEFVFSLTAVSIFLRPRNADQVT